MGNRNLVMDYYQLTMAYTYFKNNKKDEIAYFDMFYRKNPDKGGFAISAGLDEVIDYIQNFHFSESDIELLRKKGDFDEEFLNYLKNLKFTGDIYAIVDGTVVFPNEPMVTVKAPLIEAQLIETGILLRKNFASLITTKASRIKRAAKNKDVLEFGTRRAHEESAALKGSKYAYIAGALGTACVESEKEYGIKSIGTMAHSFIESFDSEYEAFQIYARTNKNNCTLLIDTYDTLKSGIKNAIRVSLEENIPLKGVRLDSGDLAYLSKEVRKELDQAGLINTKIIASNSLDERLIESLLNEGAPIDIFGVGENLITAKSEPVFGGVYKLTALEKEGILIPKIKLSDNIGKITNPGYKQTYRFYDKTTNYAIADVIALDEEINKEEYILTSEEGYNTKKINNYYIKNLQTKIFENGKLIYKLPTLNEIREKIQQELNTLYPELKRFDNPHTYIVDLSKNLLKLKKQLLEEKRGVLEEHEFRKIR